MQILNFNNIVFIPIIFSFLTTAIITPVILPFIKKLKIMDDPSTHIHPAVIHKKSIPRAGGIALFLGVLIPGLFFLPRNNIVLSLYAASFISLLVGVLDDKYDLSPYLRFAANIIAAAVVVINGVNVSFITNPFGGILYLSNFTIPVPFFHFYITLAHIIAVIWIVWVMNMLNWSKGVDGQMPGIVAISALVIGILSLRFPVVDNLSLISAQISFLITGASLGFLIYNFYPAKIFPGYGATSIYLLLAAVSILSSAKLATAILVMGIPMVDGVFTILRRVLTGRSPFWHDKKHLHHLMLSFGFGQRKIAIIYWAISAVLGGISLFLSSRGKLFAIIMVIILVGGTLISLHLGIRSKNEEN